VFAKDAATVLPFLAFNCSWLSFKIWICFLFSRNLRTLSIDFEDFGGVEEEEEVEEDDDEGEDIILIDA